MHHHGSRLNIYSCYRSKFVAVQPHNHFHKHLQCIFGQVTTHALTCRTRLHEASEDDVVALRPARYVKHHRHPRAAPSAHAIPDEDE
uniref:Uncharacterized protein n=1 Tax=Arundo donax TaxID=35708 RepID=A0A0A8ZPG1_ARUDO